MLDYHSFSSNRMLRPCLIVAALAVFFMTAGPVFGQLTQQDIEELRERGKRNGWTFEVGESEATQRPMSELCGMKEPPDWRENAHFEPFLATSSMSLPSYFDWRDSAGVTPIRNQGGCGSCWAFATVGALECNIKIVDGVEEDLSEQWLVSCNHDGYDCGGGWWAHHYHMNDTDPCGDSGAVYESEFPYQAADLPCNCPYGEHEYFIDDWGFVGQEWQIPSIDQMKQAILTYGPISVAVYVNDAFQSYRSGVFNDCEDLSINHAVVLVGWDDNQGTDGVWFLRNSWGTTWGEGGYMKIEYGCSRIGYNASYIDYRGRIRISADTTCGPMPLDVQFSAVTGFPVDTWTWDFGDGDSAFVQNPPHTYDETGIYDVTIQTEGGGEIRTNTRYDYIVVHADTIHGSTAMGNPDTQVEVTLTANNTIPIHYLKIPVEYPNGFNLDFDSFSTVGCRTSYFETQEYLHYDPVWGQRITVKLISSEIGTSPDLSPGQGAVLKLHFTIPAGAAIGETAPIILDGYNDYLPEYQAPVAIYAIESNPGQVVVSGGCCAHRGDINHDDQIDMLDILYFVEWMWQGGTGIPCEEEGDVNNDDQTDSLDLTFLVDFFWMGGDSPPACD
ncbi:MAG: hypothetical protein JSW34_08030 [Candidatus Zixiibacteriota bacterium]|nr:MAG: hypothetical protein JSW34_08030 [candidate division Zixibacteria bacterium]